MPKTERKRKEWTSFRKRKTGGERQKVRERPIGVCLITYTVNSKGTTDTIVQHTTKTFKRRPKYNSLSVWVCTALTTLQLACRDLVALCCPASSVSRTWVIGLSLILDIAFVSMNYCSGEEFAASSKIQTCSLKVSSTHHKIPPGFLVLCHEFLCILNSDLQKFYK